MYIHLGNEISVKKKNIVGIFDIENTTISKNTGHLLENATKEGRVVNVSYEMPYSFYGKRKGNSLYFADFSCYPQKKSE